MRFVFESKTEPGTVEVAWVWMPFFVAIDQKLQRTVNEKLVAEFTGQVLTDETLTCVNRRLIEIVCEHHPVTGLRDWLEQAAELIDVPSTELVC